MKSKKITYLLGILAILLAVFHIVLFTIAGFADHTATFWVAYGFMLATFFFTSAASLLLENKDMRLHDFLFRLPLLKHSFIYAAVTLIAGVVFMLLEEQAAWGTAAAVLTVILAVYLVFAVSCLFAKEAILEVDHGIAEKTSFIKELKTEVDIAVQMTDSEELKKALTELAESIRFSDPVSVPALSGIEGELALCVQAIRASLQAKDNEKALSLCGDAATLLKERNIRCKAVK